MKLKITDVEEVENKFLNLKVRDYEKRRTNKRLKRDKENPRRKT